MKRVWLTCLFVLAAASASAQPAMTTDQAVAAEVAAEQKAAQLVARKGQLARQYQDQTDTIDRLKKEKASWRRDRELRASLADSNDTATQLAQVTTQLGGMQAAVDKARAAAVAAIDAEVSAGVAGPRAQKLAQLRARLAPQAAPKKLVIPDAEIDPLADADELEQQAAALRAVESELGRQETGLDTQAKDLKTVAEIRRQHERAGDLLMRDDDQPHRNQPRSSDRQPDSFGVSGAQGTGGGTGGGSGAGGGTSSGDHFGSPVPSAFESDATVVLGDVIDHQAIEGMLRASRSGDPSQRADAAQRARDAVHLRIEQLQKKRAAIEARAKALRSKR